MYKRGRACTPNRNPEELSKDPNNEENEKEISIELSSPNMGLLRDITQYPFGTLSDEYLTTKLRIEQQTGLVLRVRKLGDGRIPAPVKIVEHWFNEFFGDPTNFFCCSSPSQSLFKLCDYLAQSPFYCLYVASVTMNSDGVVPGLEIGTSLRRDKMDLLGAQNERTQSIIGVCANPAKWMMHKNRRMIAFFIRSLINKQMQANGFKSVDDEENRQVNNKQTSVAYPFISDNMNVEGRKKRQKGNVKENDEGVFPDEVMNVLQQTMKNSTDGNPVCGTLRPRKKMRSSWSLVAYIILDKYTHSAEVIHRVSREALYSKGINNRIQTLFAIAQKQEVPIWMSKKAMEITDLISTSDVFSRIHLRKVPEGKHPFT